MLNVGDGPGYDVRGSRLLDRTIRTPPLSVRELNHDANYPVTRPAA